MVDDWSRVPRTTTVARQMPQGASQPYVAVRHDGTVGLSWIEDRTCARFSASADGGQTFGPSVALNPCPREILANFSIADHLFTVPYVESVDSVGMPNMTRKGFTVRVEPGGGASGLTVDRDGVFHPIWSIVGTDGALWTTRVVVRRAGAAPPPPLSGSLAGLVDATSGVTFSFENQEYDPGTGLVTVDVRMVNTDSLKIHGPLRVRLTRLESGLFPRIEVVNADNGERGVGAVWDMSATLTGGELGPYATGGPRQLVFRVGGGAGQFDVIHQWAAALVVTELKVFKAPQR
jgi:hypothetical protein